MAEYFVQKDGKVRRMSEAELRSRLRKNEFSGLELVRRWDQSHWTPLHATPMFVEEVPFQGPPIDAARWRRGRRFLVHLVVFLFVNAAMMAGPVFVIWGIFLVLHGARSVPPLLELHREGKLWGMLAHGWSSTPALGAGPPLPPPPPLPPLPGAVAVLAPGRSVTAPQAAVPVPLGRDRTPAATVDPAAPTAALMHPHAGDSAFDPTVDVAPGGHALAPPIGASPSIEDRQLRQSVRGKLFGDDFVDPVRVGRYRLDERIGAGGMGLVFRAHDETLDRPVAVKLLRPGYDAHMGTERLQREARAMARVSHPNVVTVHDVGVYEGSVFVAMEFIEGPTMRRWLSERRSVGDIVDVLVQAARGMAAAHAAGLIHRDFKPENVIVGDDGRVRVLDFGLAKPLDHQDGADFVTQTGLIMGTPRYMAPEQFRGEPADARTDQFALGVVLFEAIYGFHPYEPPDDRSLSQAVLAGRLRACPLRADVPAAVREALTRAVASEPDSRHASIEAFIDSLGPIPSTDDQFASLAATVRRLLHRHGGEHRSTMLTALDDIETTIAELDVKSASLERQLHPAEVRQLQSDREDAARRLEATEDDEGRALVQSQIRVLDQRLAGIDRAREVIERLRTKRSVAENQLKQLHLDLTRAEAAQTSLPDLTDPLQELRFEIDAAQEVEALLGR